MQSHLVKTHPSKANLPRESELAWKLALVAAETAEIQGDVAEMVGNRLIDNASVGLAAVNRRPVANARLQGLAHPRPGGARLFGVPATELVCAEWAAWANGTAVRELDMHDTFLAADYSHPADNIPPLLAVAEQCGKTGAELLRGIVAAYEIHMSLVKGICLHEFKKDHIGHLCPAQAAGICVMLGLNTETIYQAIQQAVHVSFTTRQSRKGEISSWKAYAPAHAGKLAVEAVDRAMRGEKSPSPIYEGEDGVIAYMLGGSKAEYHVPLPESGEARTQILESYTKEHSAEYQAQALIDLAFRLRKQISNLSEIKSIVIETSHHTHFVIGSGSADPQKYDPNASRETLDHSIMYIFAVALQDGYWHHVKSYLPERAKREDTVQLWKKITTVEDPAWTKRYHDPNPNKKAFGGRVVVTMNDGTQHADELFVADAHPFGGRPFGKDNYQNKFLTLTEGLVSPANAKTFFDAAHSLALLTTGDLSKLNPNVDYAKIESSKRDKKGIF